jgi:hypothetical protein
VTTSLYISIAENFQHKCSLLMMKKKHPFEDFIIFETKPNHGCVLWLARR